MEILRISTVDWIVLPVYFEGIAAVGLVASRHVRATANYFLGERRFGKWVMIGQTFGTACMQKCRFPPPIDP